MLVILMGVLIIEDSESEQRLTISHMRMNRLTMWGQELVFQDVGANDKGLPPAF